MISSSIISRFNESIDELWVTTIKKDYEAFPDRLCL